MRPNAAKPLASATAASTAAHYCPAAVKQLSAFIARYDPEVARLARAARAVMRKLWPTAISRSTTTTSSWRSAYCSTERTSDCIVSLAVSPKGVSLSFYYGATVPDPEHVLLGAGKQNRYLRLTSAALLKTPTVPGPLLRAAARQAETPLPASGKGCTIIKSVSAKQRPRRKVHK